MGGRQIFGCLGFWFWGIGHAAASAAAAAASAAAAAAWFWNMLLPAVADLLSKSHRLSSPILRFLVFDQRC